MAPSGGLPEPDPAASLRHLLRACRGRRRLPEAHQAAQEAGLSPPPVVSLLGRRQPEVGVTQEQVARLLHLSHSHYRDMEAGRQRISHEVCDPLAVVLGMTSGERAWLWWLSQRRAPDPVPGAIPTVPESLAHLVRTEDRGPCYITDPAFTLLVVNDLFWKVFEWAAPWSQAPTMSLPRMAVLHPRAEEVLVGWADDWAVPAVAVVWSQYQAAPRDPQLRALVAELAGATRESVRAVWARREEARVWHPEGTIRAVRDPRHGVRRLEMISEVPERWREVPGVRRVTWLWLDQLPTPADEPADVVSPDR
ncbi:hypothetical protein GCM10027168_44990 [Streptomyces capparidis]